MRISTPFALNIVCCFASIGLAPGASYAQPTLSQRIASYDMSVVLNTDDKTLAGKTTLIWVNPSADTVRDLQFHMYYNAFKNNRSTWMQEDTYYADYTDDEWNRKCPWGWTQIDAMQDGHGNDLTKGFTWLRPEDHNPDDETALDIPLTDHVPPHDTARFTYRWSAKIPRAMIRTGYNLDFYMMAQWFPKLAVYEPAGMRYAKTGGWNCHQYHANSEYYADFGNYHVNLTVPANFVIGASGVLRDTATASDGMKTWTYEADDVIDFTWAASPHFTIMQDQWKDVDISLMVYPEHRRYAPRYFDAIGHAMDIMDNWVGKYPYPVLTIVDAPIHGIFGGAMEYPTLIFTISTAFLPEGFHSVQTLTVHEFIHQYFMQMVASNEMEEPWMDEGITSFYEAEIMDSCYGVHTSMLDWMGLRMGTLEFARHEFFGSALGRNAPCNLPSWDYEGDAYSMSPYNKPVLLLKTLEGLVGHDVFREIMHTYFEEWKFHHPCAQDFIDVANSVIAKRLPQRWPDGMDWYFDEVLKGTAVCDYSVVSVSNLPEPAPLGYLDDHTDCTLPPAGREQPVHYQPKVILKRDGELKIPVDVRFTFDDGSRVDTLWGGADAIQVYHFTGNSRIFCVEIDPDGKNCLDYNYLNNSYTITPSHKGMVYYLTRLMTGVQQVMETLTFLT